MEFLPVEVIRIKREGKELSAEVIQEFVADYVSGKIPDYQMSAFLMAVFFRGLSDVETRALVLALRDSGEVIDWNGHTKFLVDKHSTGGVGDKTSLILAPIVAAAGLSVPMMSGRGLGHTGGTLDKFDSIPGFRHNISTKELIKLVDDYGLGFIGQTGQICSADKKIYALRDVTGTVESTPLICASILSKKLAEGVQGLVLDVKYGSGAFYKRVDQAEQLAQALLNVYTSFGKSGVALLTNMNQPLGFSAGNSLEVEECIAILEGQKMINFLGVDMYADTRNLSIELAAWMLHLSGKFGELSECRNKAVSILESGQALDKFRSVVKAQGGDLTKLPKADFSLDIVAEQEGYIGAFETEKIGFLNIQLGAGRSRVEDALDYSAGVQFFGKVGHRLKKGDIIMRIFGASESLLKKWAPEFLNCVKMTSAFVAPEALIYKILELGK